MAESFDPYHKWLGIPPKDQPPNHYRLLGIETFESDREVIDAAANRIMAYLKELAAGDESGLSQKLLNEISQSRICLLNKQKRREYDEQLRAEIAEQQAAKKPAAKGPPPKAKPTFAPPPKPTAAPPPPAALPPRQSSPRRSSTAPPPVDTHGSPRTHGAVATGASDIPDFSSINQTGGRPSNAPVAIKIDMEATGSHGANGEQAEAPSVSIRRKPTGKIIVVFLLGVIAAVIGVVLVILGSTNNDVAPAPETQPETQPEPSPFVQPVLPQPILHIDLSDEDRPAVTEFLIDQEPQSLPPKASYELTEGRHLLLIRRGIEQDTRALNLVNGQEMTYKPRWRLPKKAPPTPELPELDPNFQAKPPAKSP